MQPSGGKSLLWAFYGDDFTGSTDEMEALSLQGIPCALFLAAPSAEELADFRLRRPLSGDGKLNAFGVAGISRSLSPAQMEVELPSVFEQISRVNPRFFHYKTCSTFDSSPETGSIGRAIEIALRYFPGQAVPLLVGAPALNRYCMFGNLFARIGGVTYRLDRHPTMSRHPVTPMGESDLRLHLGRQTSLPVALLDYFSMEANPSSRRKVFERLMRIRPGFVLIDVLTKTHLLRAGHLLLYWTKGVEKSQLLAGSSGMAYAVAMALQKQGQTAPVKVLPPVGRVAQLLVMAGSASPVTEVQMALAERAGYKVIQLDTRNLLDESAAGAELARVQQQVLDVWATGASVVVCAARGPEDPMLGLTLQRAAQLAEGFPAGQAIAAAQGRLLRSLLDAGRMRRVVVAGGDTSGYAARALGIRALEVLRPLAPGAPLCLAHAGNAAADGLEICLKGGQNGTENFFLLAQQGGAIPEFHL